MKKQTYPDPNDSNPSTRNSLNLCETPITKARNDRRDELRDTERYDQSRRRTFHEEETMRTSDEDQSLRDDGNLEVYNHVQFGVVGGDGENSVQLDMESILEEGSLHDNDNQSNT